LYTKNPLKKVDKYIVGIYRVISTDKLILFIHPVDN